MQRRLLALFAFLALLCSCRSEPKTPGYTSAGGYGVGVRTLTLVDPSRSTPPNGTYPGDAVRTLTVELWYPSDGAAVADDARDAAVASGRFPLIVQSHGFHDDRLGEAYLARHLASHGYVVAAPDFPLSRGSAPGGATVADLPQQPGDVSFVIDSLLQDATIAVSIDGAHIGAAGLSLGGMTTLLVALHPTLHDERIVAALPIAAPSCMFAPPFFSRALPLLFLHGDADLIVPIADNSAAAFKGAQKPTTLVTLKKASHTGFVSVATAFDVREHYDRIGCAVLPASTLDLSEGLGGYAVGVRAASPSCLAVCQAPPIDPALAADRQQALTKAIGLAFFEGALRAKGDARAFIAHDLGAENRDVAVQDK
jgi:predicted dienelactone hydrolase